MIKKKKKVPELDRGQDTPRETRVVMISFAIRLPQVLGHIIIILYSVTLSGPQFPHPGNDLL